jgi:hypothetical protein
LNGGHQPAQGGLTDFGIADEHGLIPLPGLARPLRIVPVNRKIILSYVAQHSLGLPRSY